MLSKGYSVEARCEPAGEGWRCAVAVLETSRRTTYTVGVSPKDMERWGGRGTAEDLVVRAFEFLLEREPSTSILRQFDLAVIQRYFPEFDEEFRR